MSSKFHIGLCQTKVSTDKTINLERARVAIEKAVQQGAKVVVLPECFQCPYDTSAFSLYQEPIPNVGSTLSQIDPNTSPSSHLLASLAAQHNIYLIGGSIPEQATIQTIDPNALQLPTTNNTQRQEFLRAIAQRVVPTLAQQLPTQAGSESTPLTRRETIRNIILEQLAPLLIPTPAICNTNVVYNPQGTIITKHRKLHLFDIDIKGKMTFKESDSLTPGNHLSTISIPITDLITEPDTTIVPSVFNIAIGICYDLRFSAYALFARYVQQAHMFIYPGAFNMVTGPAHWQLLQQARALDTQSFVATCSPARSTGNDDPDCFDASRDKRYGYVAWGHSSVINPWGSVIATTEHEPDVVLAEIDLAEVSTIRQNIPITNQMRFDVYSLQELYIDLNDISEEYQHDVVHVLQEFYVKKE